MQTWYREKVIYVNVSEKKKRKKETKTKQKQKLLGCLPIDIVWKATHLLLFKKINKKILKLVQYKFIYTFSKVQKSIQIFVWISFKSYILQKWYNNIVRAPFTSLMKKWGIIANKWELSSTYTLGSMFNSAKQGRTEEFFLGGATI